jgi:hypothetical protein
MGKTYTIRINVSKDRQWFPIKRSEVFQDRRERRQRTRNNQLRQAIKEQ